MAVVSSRQHSHARHVVALHCHVTWQLLVEGWCRGVHNRDDLSQRCAIATFIFGGERTGHSVRLSTCARSCICNQRDGHFTTVVRGRGVVERVLIAALSRVILRNRQLGSRRVLNGDGLRQRCAVVAIVCCSERPNNLVVLWARAWDDFLLLVDGHIAVAVVGSRSIVVGDFLITLDGVIRRNRQVWSRGIHEAQELLEHRDVFALVGHGVCTHVHSHRLDATT